MIREPTRLHPMPRSVSGRRAPPGTTASDWRARTATSRRRAPPTAGPRRPPTRWPERESPGERVRVTLHRCRAEVEQVVADVGERVRDAEGADEDEEPASA